MLKVNCVTYIPEEAKSRPIKVVFEDGAQTVINDFNIETIYRVPRSTLGAKLAALDCSFMLDEEFEELCKEYYI